MGDRLETLLEAIKDMNFNLPLPQATKATITASPTILLVSQKIISANPLRKGLILYNNSANSVYVALGSAANSNTNMTFIIPTFAHLSMALPVFTGDVYGVRNAGSGVILVTELT